MSELLDGKNILIMGIRNKWSIAWGIAKVAADLGANVILTYAGDREKENAMELSKDLNCKACYKCDISSDDELEEVFSEIQKTFGVLHGLVHSIANAKSEDLANDFVYTSRDGFAHAMNISVYSLVAACRYAKPIMSQEGSILTLTYLGAEKVLPGYNVMGVAKAALEASVRYLASDLGPQGVRVNAISAGPIKTLSAKGVKDFSNILDVVEKKAPLRRGIEQNDLGNVAAFLLSNMSSSVTGEVMHVDCGYNIMGI